VIAETWSDNGLTAPMLGLGAFPQDRASGLC
jgi:hypothetical protein